MNDELFMARTTSRQWLGAAARQAERCLDAHSSLISTISAANHNTEQRIDAQEAMRVEEHFLLIALGKADEWLERLSSLKPQHQVDPDELRRHLPHLRHVRNMREHDSDYFVGDGNVQARFIHVERDSTGTAVFQADASSTVIDGSRYLIGGRLDVDIAMATTQRLRTRLFVSVDTPWQT